MTGQIESLGPTELKETESILREFARIHGLSPESSGLSVAHTVLATRLIGLISRIAAPVPKADGLTLPGPAPREPSSTMTTRNYTATMILTLHAGSLTPTTSCAFTYTAPLTPELLRRLAADLALSLWRSSLGSYLKSEHNSPPSEPKRNLKISAQGTWAQWAAPPKSGVALRVSQRELRKPPPSLPIKK